MDGGSALAHQATRENSMSVIIHGNEYKTVAERVRAFLEDNAESEDIGVATEIVNDNEKVVTVKASVRIGGRVFTGHAQSRRDAQSVEGQAPLEVAETSAVGRALGFAGYGMIDSIASAEEVKVAQGRPLPGRTVPDPRIPPTDAGDAPHCKFTGCGKVTSYRQGPRKDGRTWGGGGWVKGEAGEEGRKGGGGGKPGLRSPKLRL